jgi:hypothetical protein
MRENAAWASRALLLPLLPAIIGTALRAVYAGRWSIEAVDAAELAFSFGLIGVIVLSSVNRLTDKALRDALSPVFVILLSIALGLFAGSVFIKLVHESEQADILSTIRSASILSKDSFKALGASDRCTRIYGQIRTATLITGATALVLALAARVKYSLEE